MNSLVHYSESSDEEEIIERRPDTIENGSNSKPLPQKYETKDLNWMGYLEDRPHYKLTSKHYNDSFQQKINEWENLSKKNQFLNDYIWQRRFTLQKALKLDSMEGYSFFLQPQDIPEEDKFEYLYEKYQKQQNELHQQNILRIQGKLPPRTSLPFQKSSIE